MKHILVYSDSLSWSLIPATREGHSLAKRGCANMQSTQLPTELTKIAHSKSSGFPGANPASKMQDLDGVHLHEKDKLNLGKTLAKEPLKLKNCL